jgi:hypothetical protein
MIFNQVADHCRLGATARGGMRFQELHVSAIHFHGHCLHDKMVLTAWQHVNTRAHERLLHQSVMTGAPLTQPGRRQYRQQVLSMSGGSVDPGVSLKDASKLAS